jgi:ABC-type nitrate/sulfonate/bicarbonate transport system substrate-binding protein
MGKRAWDRAFLVLTAISLLLACAVAWSPAPEPRAPIASDADLEAQSAVDDMSVDPVAPGTLRIGVPGNCYSGLLAVAERRGLFAAANQPVELVSFPSGRRAFRSLLSGEVDLAVVGDIPIASEMLDRSDFAVVAVLGRSSFDRWVVARPGLKSATSLSGKRIATQKRSGSHYVLEAYLDRVGVPLSRVEIVDMPPQDMPKALASGRVDAFAVESPYSAPAEEEFGMAVEELKDPGAYRLAFALVARRSVIEGAPQGLQNLLRGLIAAADAWKSDADGAVHDLTDVLLVDAAKGARQCRFTTFEVALDRSVLEAIEREASWFSHHGRDYGKPPPDVARLFDAAPLRVVAPLAVRL